MRDNSEIQKTQKDLKIIHQFIGLLFLCNRAVMASLFFKSVGVEERGSVNPPFTYIKQCSSLFTSVYVKKYALNS